MGSTIPPRALRPEERTAVLEVLRSDRFVDKSPLEVWATILDEGVYYCSCRTMYRILADNKEVRERRNQLCHPNYKKPELLATAPNEVWSWDITKLLGPAKWASPTCHGGVRGTKMEASATAGECACPP